MRNVAKAGVFLFLLAFVAGAAYFSARAEAVTVQAKDSKESILIDDNTKVVDDSIDTVSVEVEVAAESGGASARKFRATAYCLKGKTASGRYVRRGIVAADPRVLPLGTRIHMTGGKYTGNYVVADTGGKIKGRVLDIWVPSCSEARSWGRRTVSVKVTSKKSRKRRK